MAGNAICPGSIARAIGRATVKHAVITTNETRLCGRVCGLSGRAAMMAGGINSGKIGRKQDRVVTVLKTAVLPAEIDLP